MRYGLIFDGWGIIEKEKLPDKISLIGTVEGNFEETQKGVSNMKILMIGPDLELLEG